MPGTLFDSADTPLRELLDSIESGALQLPEFQRELVWNLPKRRRLLQSIQRGFPTGSILLMEVEGDPPFGFKPIQNMEHVASDAPSSLALDGQQRLTTLAHAFLKSQKSPNNYYFDLVKLQMSGVQPDAIEIAAKGIVVQLKKKQGRTDKSALFDENLLAAHLYFSDVDRRQLLAKYKETLRNGGNHVLATFVDTELDAFIDEFTRYEFPVVTIKRRASLEVVSTIFTEINTQAQKLSSFDLCVAKFYRESHGNFDLRSTLKDLKAANNDLKVVDGDGTNFLQSIALFSGKENKKASLPDNLNYGDVSSQQDNVIKALSRTSQELQNLLKVSTLQEIPYDALIPPLSKAMASFPRRVQERGPVQHRITQWVVASALKRRYTEGTDVTQRADIDSVVPWVLGNSSTVPAFIREPWVIDEDVLTSSASSSRGKMLMLSLRLNDWQDPMYSQEKVDNHHIFPSSYLRGISKKPKEINFFLNRTWLSRATNQAIGNDPPSKYVRDKLIPATKAKYNCSDSEAENRLKSLLEDHFINSDAYDALIADDYEAFLVARMNGFGAWLKDKFGVVSSSGGEEDEDAPVEEGVDEEDE